VSTGGRLEEVLCGADQRSLADRERDRRAAAPITFVLEPSVHEWLLAEQHRLAPGLREAVGRTVPEDGGHRLTMSRELALELAYLFVDEGRRRGGIGALDDMWLVAVTTIGLEMWMWSPLAA
jgi:hypothetical protein